MRNIFFVIVIISLIAGTVLADGKIVMPKDYKGSLEESAQEAIIIFTGEADEGKYNEDLILKITVVGEASNFAWVVPFPNEPEIAKEDNKLFEELFNYVEHRQTRYHNFSEDTPADAATDNKMDKPVKLIKREIVGSFDISVVQEQTPGTLNGWLEENGYQKLENAEDVISFYSQKNYVFACIKVNEAELQKDKPVDIHPLRFTFDTGGKDGIYFPMKMTGLQNDPFTVNLYVFYKAWLNKNLNRFGYVHRGFALKFRDFDSKSCTPNAGKLYSTPNEDPYLRGFREIIPTVSKLFQKLYPGARFYMTNIISDGEFEPANVRDWKDDLWLFPHYRDKNFVPYDVQNNGIASEAYPGVKAYTNARPKNSGTDINYSLAFILVIIGIVILDAFIIAVIILIVKRKKRQHFVDNDQMLN